MQPTEITDNPITLLDGTTTDASGSNTDSDTSVVLVPNTQVDQTFPQAVIAHETISQSLNTETKRIMADYTFESLGAITISSPIHPLANISISGEGIVATDANGATTFTLDGETGDATFKGTILAGSLISEGIIEGGSISIGTPNISNQYPFTVDSNGKVVIGINDSGSDAAISYYDSEGTLVGKFVADVGSFPFIFNGALLGGIVKVYEDAVNIGVSEPYIIISVDDGLFINGKMLRLSTGGYGYLPDAGNVSIYTDASGGKDRLMIKFHTGAAQQIAIEP